jgi:GNAT superfamily N-acetyltransferase
VETRTEEYAAAASGDSHAAGVDALTMDGRIVRVRSTRSDDAGAIRDLYERASPESRYMRFFGGGAAIEAEVHRLVRPADGDHVALLVEQDTSVVAVAGYERIDDDTAEFAVFVDDTRQGQGIGTLVLEHLAAAARRAGIAELVGDVLAANTRMLRVSGDLAPGVARVYGPDHQVIRVRVPARPGEAALDAVGLRDRTAEHRSLRPMLAPGSVAVVGAGGRRTRRWRRSASRWTWPSSRFRRPPWGPRSPTVPQPGCGPRSS